MTELEKMEKGLIYDCTDSEVLNLQTQCVSNMSEYNTLGLNQQERMAQLLSEMFARVGKDTCILPPFYANWGGAHVHLGERVFANYNLTLVDDGNIYIGDYTMIGPNVTIATASHPILPNARMKGLQYNVDVHIGNNVWIGSNAVILPGVHIGDNTVIGAGSVVTRDIPSNVIAVGNPCKVLRIIDTEGIDYDNYMAHTQQEK
ncbi:MAG: sugar O-acetyltransferase [Clostridia bacterium]|nr:sugar O-acetyltransferase [Clostridia bacterium]